MRNTEGYADPTAGKAMNPNQRPQSLKTLTAPPREKPVKKPVQKKNTVYYCKPAYVAK